MKAQVDAAIKQDRLQAHRGDAPPRRLRARPQGSDLPDAEVGAPAAHALVACRRTARSECGERGTRIRLHRGAGPVACVRTARSEVGSPRIRLHRGAGPRGLRAHRAVGGGEPAHPTAPWRRPSWPACAPRAPEPASGVRRSAATCRPQRPRGRPLPLAVTADGPPPDEPPALRTGDAVVVRDRDVRG